MFDNIYYLLSTSIIDNKLLETFVTHTTLIIKIKRVRYGIQTILTNGM